jgi:O-antigen/teichoic acid export membrane protein
MSLRKKTLSGMFWSFTDYAGNQLVQFVIGIILARLLTPSDYGLVGIVMVFIIISQTFVDSGFSQALIRKLVIDQKDYSTVFFFNISISTFIYLIIILISPFIGSFFQQKEIVSILRVLSLILIIDSFMIVQKIILIKNIDFKMQAKLSMISNIASGIIGITMAYYGFGVWSLVYRTILNSIFLSSLLWIFTKWKLTFEFSFESLKEMFNFGSKLLISSLLNNIYNNVNYFIIGKYFPMNELGFYTRADQFKNLMSNNLTMTIQRVSYPALASIQNDKSQLKYAYRSIIKLTMFISFSLMFGMAAIAKPMIMTLIGVKWLGCVEYLQLLCFAGVLYPLQALNSNILIVKGRSDLYLKLEIIKKILVVPVIILGIALGIKAMIVGMIVNSVIAYYINAFYSGKLISYSIKAQFIDIFPSFALSLTVAAIVYVCGNIFPLSPIMKLIVQILMGIGLTVLFSKIVKLDEFMEIKKMTNELIWPKEA